MGSDNQDKPIIGDAYKQPKTIDIVISDNARVTIKKMPQIADQEDSDIM